MSSLAVVACSSGSGAGTASSISPVPSGSPASAVGAGPTFTATLQPVASGGTRIAGAAKLSPTAPGEYRFEVSIRNAGGMQVSYPWIIRTGQCGETRTATDLGNPVAYRALQTGSDGSARTTGPLKVQLMVGTVYHVDVLKSPQDRDTVVACGVLSPS